MVKHVHHICSWDTCLFEYGPVQALAISSNLKKEQHYIKISGGFCKKKNICKLLLLLSCFFIHTSTGMHIKLICKNLLHLVPHADISVHESVKKQVVNLFQHLFCSKSFVFKFFWIMMSFLYYFFSYFCILLVVLLPLLMQGFFL